MSVFCFIAITLAILSDVVGRELIGASIYGSQRFAVLASTITSFLGFAIVVGTGGHLNVPAFGKLIPQRLNPFLDRAGSAVSAILCAGFSYYSARFVYETYSIGETMLAFNYPLWPVQLLLPYAFFSAAVRFLIFFIAPEHRPAEDALAP